MIKGNFTIRKSEVINRRMFIIGAAKLIIFGGLIARLFSLQINDNKKYLTLSDKNRIREWKLPPTRGNIVCLLYTSPSPRDVEESRMPSSA